MTMSYCLSPLLRFNKADWTYIQSLSVGVNPIGAHDSSPQGFIVIRPRPRTASLIVLRIDICASIYIEIRRCRVTVWFYDFQIEMNWSWQSYLCVNHLVIYFWIKMTWSWRLYSLYIFRVRVEVTCSLRVFHLWYRGNDLSW